MTKIIPFPLFYNDSFISKLFTSFSPLLLFLLLFFFIVPKAEAQVIIKEKVTIQPKVKSSKPKRGYDTITSEYYPCGPFIRTEYALHKWQVVWINSTYHLDVGQQAFNYQDNAVYSSIAPISTYDFEITEGSNLSRIMIHSIDTVNGIPEYIFEELEGNVLYGISGLDMEGEGGYRLLQGVPTKDGFRKYTIHFDSPGIVTFKLTTHGNQEIRYYHTQIVEPDFQLEYIGSYDISHGEEIGVRAELKIVQCRGEYVFDSEAGPPNGGSPPYGVLYGAEIISGSEYGTLVNVVYDGFFIFRDMSSSFSGLETMDHLKFLANGIEPADTGNVRIRYTASGYPSIDTDLIVVKNEEYPIGVTLEPDKLSAGETAVITLTKRVENFGEFMKGEATYIDFPEDQLFNVEIVRGENLGTLYSESEGGSGDIFYYIEQTGLIFIVDENAESGDISIKVTTMSNAPGQPSSAPVSLTNNQKVENSADAIDPAPKGEQASLQKKGKNKEKVDFILPPSDEVEIMGIGIAEIKSGGCEEFACDEKPELPAFTTKIYTEDLINGETICPSPDSKGRYPIGQFKPLKYIESPNIEICYNKTGDKWEFSAGNGNVVTVPVLLDLCWDNIRNHYKYTVIENLNDVEIKLSTYQGDVCNDYFPGSPLSDFLGHFSYPGLMKKYLIKEITYEHELEHQKEFLEFFENNYFHLNKTMEKHRKSCVQMSYEEATKVANNTIPKLLKEHLAFVRMEFDDKHSSEQDTQDRIKSLVLRYIDKIDSLCN